MLRSLRFTFLGTGTSSGVPAIACDCAVCTSTDPRDRRLRTSAAVRFTDSDGLPRTVLLDCSPDLREQALRFGLRRCDAVLFTHNHVDHTWGVDELRRFNVVQNSAIPIYAEQHTMEHLQRVYKHIFDRQNNVNDSFVATLVPCRMTAGEPIELHGMRFEPLRLIHGKLPIVGFRIEPVERLAAGETSAFPLAYCTDVSSIPPETWPRLRGVRTLVLDALRYKHHPTHLTMDEALRIAERVGADNTYFIHMSHDLGHAQTQANLPDSVHLAYDGLVI